MFAFFFSMELDQLMTSLVFFQCWMFVAVFTSKTIFSTSCLLTFQVPGSIPAVAARSLQVGSVSV